MESKVYTLGREIAVLTTTTWKLRKKKRKKTTQFMGIKFATYTHLMGQWQVPSAR